MCVSEITAAGFCGLCGGVNSFAGKPSVPYFGNLALYRNSPPVTDGENKVCLSIFHLPSATIRKENSLVLLLYLGIADSSHKCSHLCYSLHKHELMMLWMCWRLAWGGQAFHPHYWPTYLKICLREHSSFHKTLLLQLKVLKLRHSFKRRFCYSFGFVAS